MVDRKYTESSIKRGIFMDKQSRNGGLSIETGVFMDVRMEII